MTLANPIFLWSLLGLSIPLAIHLLSRKEGQVIRLGSIRHVQETSTQQFKGIKLNEILLLALRCAMIFLFSLLLSGLQCSSFTNEKWVVVEKDLEDEASVKTLIDSLRKDGYEQHQLIEGFPTFSNDTLSGINYWSLADQLGEKGLSSAVVFASNRLEGFSGKRIALPGNIKWIDVPLKNVDYTLQAIQLNKDSIFLRMGHSGSDETSFSTQRMKSSTPSIPVSPLDSIRISIVSDAAYSYDQRILVAALRAIKKTFPVGMKIRESNPSKFSLANSDWCIWLTDKNIPESHSVNVIRMQPTGANELIIHSGSKSWSLTKRLNEEVALEENLTLKLAELIIPSVRLSEIARANDRRVMPDSMAWSQTKLAQSTSVLPSTADRFLIICLCVLLLIERIIAYQRGQ